MRFKETRRFYHIIAVFLRYGIDEIVPYNRYTRYFHCWRKTFFWLKNKHKDLEIGVRLRLALQELGPVWIKLGQMLSTRRDLFSAEMADQLALLQDQVGSYAGKMAKAQIEEALGDKLETWFVDFDETALASASIAQVHTAKFRPDIDAHYAGKEVVFKVIRPNIEPQIRDDIALMYKIATWIPRLAEGGRRLRPVEVVQEYEKTLMAELDLRREMTNAMQLRRNFNQSPLLYIPEMYTEFCRKQVIVMERIYGISVSDVKALKANGTDMKLLAERGVQVFFTQVFRDSFFHADMHPGNIFVSYEHPEDPQYIGIDCGIVGTLNKEDKRYMAENFLAFFQRDYHRVAQLHIDSGWVPPETNVLEFEQAMRTVCDPIFAKPLSEISFGNVLLHLFNTAREYHMQVQPQLVLLQKTLLYIEGLGRQLYPQLDLWQTAMPFLQNWLDEQVGVKALLKTVNRKLPYWREYLPELPEALLTALQQQKQIGQALMELNRSLEQNRVEQRKQRITLGIGGIIFMGTLWQFNQLPFWLAIGLLAIALGVGLMGWYRK